MCAFSTLGDWAAALGDWLGDWAATLGDWAAALRALRHPGPGTHWQKAGGPPGRLPFGRTLGWPRSCTPVP